MLRIQPAQMKAFQAVADLAFVKKLATYLREKHGDTGVILPDGAFLVFELSSEILESMIQSGVARARSYDFVSEADLAGFVVLMFETAPNFDAHPLLRYALKNEHYKIEERLDALLQNATEANWQVVKQEYDPARWQLKIESEEQR